ncbi:RHS repeat-associated core domain-containing protein [Pinirhizobacter soli]|uniref:RHS repeat-associated core domain-containing protein n=1 Tax=Pinirhizobacter soli TaxID=2786953 RepID=UPI00202A2D3D
MAHASGPTKVTYYYTDSQGTVLATTDDAGNVLTAADRRPYGEQVMGNPKSGRGYTGHFDDSDSGFIYMQARYYDPSSARFLSADPKTLVPGAPTQFARYSYANNNPIANIDPDGRRAIVANGQIYIRPENGAAPAIGPIPNNVGAVGFGPGNLSFHTYDVRTPSTLSLTQARDGLMYNPTPGWDLPASPGGTKNNVGNIPIMDGDNFVRSYVVASPDPTKYSDIVVNYTIAGDHKLAEGYVMRFGEKIATAQPPHTAMAKELGVARVKIALFLICACLGMAVSYTLLKMRYGWYLLNQDAHFLDIGFLAAAGAVVVLWSVFPSRVAVALVGAMVFVFPPILRPETFVAVDLPFASFSLIPIALLVLATYLRRTLGTRTRVA